MPVIYLFENTWSFFTEPASIQLDFFKVIAIMEP